MDISKITPSINSEFENISPIGNKKGNIGQVGKTFTDLLDALSEQQNTSDDLMQRLSAGEDVDIHQVLIATEETDISFRVAMAIRDRLVEAYRDINRMMV